MQCRAQIRTNSPPGPFSRYLKQKHKQWTSPLCVIIKCSFIWCHPLLPRSFLGGIQKMRHKKCVIMTRRRTRHLKCVVMTQCVVMTRQKMRHASWTRTPSMSASVYQIGTKILFRFWYWVLLFHLMQKLSQSFLFCFRSNLPGWGV